MRAASSALIVLSLIWAGAIFFLTEQTPEETSRLSSSVEQKLVGGETADVSHAVEAASSGEEESVSSSRGVGGDPISATLLHGILSAASVRQWAHTAEFFVLGILFASGAVFLHIGFRRGGSLRLFVPVLAALAFCVVNSLFDQTHKLFVPGREFDARDLGFDALGYLAAIALVVGVVVLLRNVIGAIKHPSKLKHRF